MTVYAKIKCTSVSMEPQIASAVPVGSIYLDANNANVLTTKTTGGSEVPLTEATASIFIKRKRNMSGVVIPAQKKVALKPDGSICLADNNDPGTRLGVGWTQEEILPEAYGNVLLVGANVANALLGLSFTSADTIMLGNTAGALTNDMGSFNIETDTILKLGYADCASDTCSAEATDLIIATEVLSSPAAL